MERLDKFRELADRLGRASFAESQPPFLVKVPKTYGAGEERSDPKMEFRTAHVGIDDIDPFGGEWRVAPITKRPGKPFPERITVGRAPNADVVLRLPYVSKLHAYFQTGADGELRLHDHSSANGTAVNGVTVPPGDEGVPVRPGDKVAFGALELKLVDAAELFDLL